MSALSNISIPSLLPLSSLKFYQATSKTVAFIQLLQPYLYMIYIIWYVSPIAIKHHKVECGIDTIYVLPFVQTSIGTVVEYMKIAIALCHVLNCQYSSVHLCPEWWVYPTKVRTANPSNRLYWHQYYLISSVISFAPLCQSVCWSNLLKLHELWLAISTIMYPPCIIHAPRSFWLSPGENTRGESHPAPTKPRGFVSCGGSEKKHFAFLIIRPSDDL